MLYTWRNYEFEVPNEFLDDTIYTYENPDSGETLEIYFDDYMPGEDNIAAVAQGARERVAQFATANEMPVAVGDQETVRFCGRNAVYYAYQLQDGDGKTEDNKFIFTELDTARYARITYRAPAGIDVYEKHFLRILDSNSDDSDKTVVKTTEKFKRRRCGALWIDMPASLSEPGDFSLSSTYDDEFTIDVIFLSQEDQKKDPDTLKALLLDTVEGLANYGGKSEPVSKTGMAGYIIKYTRQGDSAKELVCNARLDFDDGTLVLVEWRAPEPLQGKLDNAVDEIITSIKGNR